MKPSGESAMLPHSENSVNSENSESGLAVDDECASELIDGYELCAIEFDDVEVRAIGQVIAVEFTVEVCAIAFIDEVAPARVDDDFAVGVFVQAADVPDVVEAVAVGRDGIGYITLEIGYNVDEDLCGIALIGAVGITDDIREGISAEAAVACGEIERAVGVDAGGASCGLREYSNGVVGTAAIVGGDIDIGDGISERQADIIGVGDGCAFVLYVDSASGREAAVHVDNHAVCACGSVGQDQLRHGGAGGGVVGQRPSIGLRRDEVGIGVDDFEQVVQAKRQVMHECGRLRCGCYDDGYVGCSGTGEVIGNEHGISARVDLLGVANGSCIAECTEVIGARPDIGIGTCLVGCIGGEGERLPFARRRGERLGWCGIGENVECKYAAHSRAAIGGNGNHIIACVAEYGRR